jgi:dTDP-4-dehydrorhamnose reductase
MKTMLRLGAERDELRVVADQVGTPTPAALIADVTAELLRLREAPSGTFHLTPRGETSWHGFAVAIFAEALARGLIARAPKLIPIATSEYPTRAHRPAYSCLDISKVEAHVGRRLPDWSDGLRRVLTS